MINSPEKFLQDYQDIFSDDNIAKDNLKRITVQLNSIFETAFDIDRDNTSELIASFILGTQNNRLISDKKAYDSYIRHHLGTSNYINNRRNNPTFSKQTLANMEVEDFKMAFELDKKILVRLVCIDRLVNNQEFDVEEIYFESAGSLINRLQQSVIDWKFLTDLMDKRIRNASSHLDFYYDDHSFAFKGKNVNSRLKTIEEFSVSPEEFLSKIMPNTTNIIQSFIAAGILLCLKPYEKYYEQALAVIE